jgi:hypothetical protein
MRDYSKNNLDYQKSGDFLAAIIWVGIIPIIWPDYRSQKGPKTAAKYRQLKQSPYSAPPIGWWWSRLTNQWWMIKPDRSARMITFVIILDLMTTKQAEWSGLIIRHWLVNLDHSGPTWWPPSKPNDQVWSSVTDWSILIILDPLDDHQASRMIGFDHPSLIG